MKAPAQPSRKRTHPAAKPLTPKQAAPDIQAPTAWQVALEARAPWELFALMATMPWWSQLPRGDGHPVVVYPGLGAADYSTFPMRRVLQALGYPTYAWEQGLNLGPRGGVLSGCREQLREVYKRHGQAASLVGWSLGGLYARELAKDEPDCVRGVITLGTPFTGPARATHAWRLYEVVSGQSTHDPALRKRLAQPPPCPTTSIYSRSDGVVAWRCSLNPEGPLTENIEVQASHIGMGLNPVALYAVADRLSQPKGRWRKLDNHGVKRWFFKDAPAEALHAGP
jgi:pimeloyl-ACP methyl ester carboxylesterase